MSADHLSDGSIGAMPLGGVAPAGLCQALHEVDLSRARSFGARNRRVIRAAK